MTTSPPKPPPRFIPTLTEVVQPGSVAVSAVTPPVPAGGGGRAPLPTAAKISSVPAQGMPLPATKDSVERAVASPPPATPSSRSVQDAMARPAPMAAPANTPRAQEAVPKQHQTLPEGFEEFMVHRVMQRVDVMLEKRLRDAIATVVQEQTRSVLPRLREEIESVVRHSVYEAVAEELAAGQAPASVA